MYWIQPGGHFCPASDACLVLAPGRCGALHSRPGLCGAGHAEGPHEGLGDVSMFCMFCFSVVWSRCNPHEKACQSTCVKWLPCWSTTCADLQLLRQVASDPAMTWFGSLALEPLCFDTFGTFHYGALQQRRTPFAKIVKKHCAAALPILRFQHGNLIAKCLASRSFVLGKSGHILFNSNRN